MKSRILSFKGLNILNIFFFYLSVQTLQKKQNAGRWNFLHAVGRTDTKMAETGFPKLLSINFALCEKVNFQRFTSRFQEKITKKQCEINFIYPKLHKSGFLSCIADNFEREKVL